VSEETWSAVDAFFEERLIDSDPALAAVVKASQAAGLPSIQVSASQGKLLQLLALAQASRRILEIGTLGGYSALWLVRALPPDGRLVTLEVEPRHAAVARQNFAQAGVARQIDLHEGPALETLARFRTQGEAPFDFVFIDADKPNNLNYLQAAVDLSRAGTLIVVDNVVRGGKVVSQARDRGAEGVRRMVDWIATASGVRATVIQTVGTKGYDGFLLARVEASLLSTPRLSATP
jgi:predicted O-methyltransferase YrrM